MFNDPVIKDDLTGQRVQIVEAAGLNLDDVFPGALKEIVLADGAPEHVGKEGVLIYTTNKELLVWTDDGYFISGHKCWWVPIG